jgi:hypothetical protein
MYEKLERTIILINRKERKNAMNDITRNTQEMIQAELAKLLSDIDKTRAETARLQIEIGKMIAETAKIQADTKWHPFLVVAGVFGAISAVIGGLIKLFA